MLQNGMCAVQYRRSSSIILSCLCRVVVNVKASMHLSPKRQENIKFRRSSGTVQYSFRELVPHQLSAGPQKMT